MDGEKGPRVSLLGAARSGRCLPTTTPCHGSGWFFTLDAHDESVNQGGGRLYPHLTPELHAQSP